MRTVPGNDDRLTPWATAVVGLCAAALNFNALTELAGAAGYAAWLAWCYPVCVDAYGLTAARVWLRAVHSARVQRWAKLSSVFVLLLSMAAAGLHAFAVGGELPTWAAFAVSTLPALMLGLAVHLLVLVRSDASRLETIAPGSGGDLPATAELVPSEPPPALHQVAVKATAPVRKAPASKRAAARAFYDAEIGRHDPRGSSEIGSLLARRFGVHEATARQWVAAFRREDSEPAGQRFDRPAAS